MGDMHRISFDLPEDLQKQIEELRTEKYSGLSYAEIYRRTINAGILASKNVKVSEKEN